MQDISTCLTFHQYFGIKSDKKTHTGEWLRKAGNNAARTAHFPVVHLVVALNLKKTIENDASGLHIRPSAREGHKGIWTVAI